MTIIKLFLLSVSGFLMNAGCFAQQAQSNDLAINHNNLLKEKTSDGVYKLIGTYKVIGSSFLFGEKNKGNLFSSEAKAYAIFLSYNTYNQDIEFYSTANPDKPLIKKPGEVDSFFILPSPDLGFTNPLKFIYGALLGSNDKMYFEEIYIGSKFGIYKRYKSDLDYVSGNYIQSELRQFDLSCEYYFTDIEKKTVRKIKPNAASVIKEFKAIKDLSAIVSNDDFSTGTDDAFTKVFTFLNN